MFSSVLLVLWMCVFVYFCFFFPWLKCKWIAVIDFLCLFILCMYNMLVVCTNSFCVAPFWSMNYATHYSVLCASHTNGQRDKTCFSIHSKWSTMCTACTSSKNGSCVNKQLTRLVLSLFHYRFSLSLPYFFSSFYLFFFLYWCTTYTVR